MKKYVIIFLLLSGTLTLFAQQTLSGVLTNAGTNTPLPGITVTVKGRSGGTSTNAAGRFSVSAADGETLVFGH